MNENAEAEVKKGDKRRKDFYNYHTQKTWGDPGSFDMILDSGTLGIEKCVKIIKALNE